MEIVEIGIKLEHDLKYYEDILKEVNAINTFSCETHDIYYANKSLFGLSENEMKSSCVRLRMVRSLTNKEWSCTFQNYQIFDDTSEDKFKCDYKDIASYEKKLVSSNWKKVFDTEKIDYQYKIDDMKSRIQLQDIKDIGLLLYYDNPDYYNLPIIEQRKKLIDELNSYGFIEFDYNILGLDKLRTLYYKKECFSNNQNG